MAVRRKPVEARYACVVCGKKNVYGSVCGTTCRERGVASGTLPLRKPGQMDFTARH